MPHRIGSESRRSMRSRRHSRTFSRRGSHSGEEGYIRRQPARAQGRRELRFRCEPGGQCLTRTCLFFSSSRPRACRAPWCSPTPATAPRFATGRRASTNITRTMRAWPQSKLSGSFPVRLRYTPPVAPGRSILSPRVESNRQKLHGQALSAVVLATINQAATVRSEAR